MNYILDLYCGAGLAADGWAAAGYTPVGVDLFPQPNYPYEFHEADALEWLRTADLSRYSVITGSPPCQALTRAKHLRDAQGGESKFDDLLTPTLAYLRTYLQETPWIIENVEAKAVKAVMGTYVTMCGSMFKPHMMKRHRLFCSNVPLRGSGCDHSLWPLDPITGKHRPWGIYHVPGDSIPQGGRTCRNVEHAMECMDITRPLRWEEIKEGYQPIYSEILGRQLRAVGL